MIFHKLAKYVLLLITSIIFIAVFAFVSSPFTFRYVGDSSIFILLGKLFTLGEIPYVEYFDHKGPSLVLVEAIGQFLIADRGGVFIIEIINLFLCMILIDRTCKVLDTKNAFPIAIVSFLCVFSIVMTGGNTSEEFCLVPLFVAGLYVAHFLKSSYLSINIRSGFFVGLAFSFVFWMRLNNAGFIVALCVFVFIQSLIDRQYRHLWNYSVGFVLGQLPFTLFYILYFSFFEGLYDMFYATFIFNSKYVSQLFSIRGEAFYFNYLLVLLAVVASFCYSKSRKEYKIWLFTAICVFISYVSINIGYAFAHYYILMVPAIIFYIILLMSFCPTRILNVLSLVFVLLFSAYTIRKAYYMYSNAEYFNSSAMEANKEINQFLDIVPKDESSRVYYYNVDPNFYLLADRMPNYKFFTLQEWHGVHDNDIFDTINITMVSPDGPLWFVTSSDVASFSNKGLIDILDKYFVLVKQNEEFSLYQRR